MADLSAYSTDTLRLRQAVGRRLVRAIRSGEWDDALPEGRTRQEAVDDMEAQVRAITEELRARRRAARGGEAPPTVVVQAKVAQLGAKRSS